jgi:predicted transcriptional regulator
VLETAVATYAIKLAAEVTNSDTSSAVSNADRWLAFNSVDSDAPPVEHAFYSLALADDAQNATARLETLSTMQTENGSIGNAENTSWAAVALSTSNDTGLLRSAGKAVQWLSSQKDLEDADLALSAYAQTVYERRCLEVRASTGNAIAQPNLIDGGAPAGAKAPTLEAPYWLGPLGTLLLTIGAVGLFARLRTEDRILTKGRHRILEYLRSEPGQDQAGIQRDLQLSTGSAVYNLNVLADKGYLTVHRDGRHKRYYVNGNALRPVANGMTKYIVSALRNINTKRMALFLLERPGAAQKEVSEGLSLDPSTVHWHAERLRKVGALSSMREGRNVAYRIERPEVILQILSFIP